MRHSALKRRLRPNPLPKYSEKRVIRQELSQRLSSNFKSPVTHRKVRNLLE